MHGSLKSVPFALVVAALVWGYSAPKAMAQYPTPRPQPCKVYPPAPDMRGPGYYVANGACGAPHGPCYNVTPPFPPFQGMVGPVSPGQGCFSQMGMLGLQGQGIPFHRFVRSPRDFYMQDGVTGGPCK